MAGYRVKPSAQTAFALQLVRLLRQYNEHGLHRILGVVDISQHPQTGPIDHLPMPGNKLRSQAESLAPKCNSSHYGGRECPYGHTTNGFLPILGRL